MAVNRKKSIEAKVKKAPKAKVRVMPVKPEEITDLHERMRQLEAVVRAHEETIRRMSKTKLPKMTFGEVMANKPNGAMIAGLSQR